MLPRFGWVRLLIGPALFLLIELLPPLEASNPASSHVLAVLLWMAAWWILEPIPLGVTALLPVVLFPLLDVLPTSVVASEYASSIIFLFIGGFLVAYAMEKWNLHRRIALNLIAWVGVSPARLMLGFFIAAYGLSMWISNSATTLMLIAPAIAIIGQIERQSPSPQMKRFSVMLLIGIAYAASLGGTATLVGSPPNLILANYLEQNPQVGGHLELTFFNWFLFGFPLSLLLLFIMYFWFRWKFCRFEATLDKSAFTQQLRELGPLRFEERVVLYVFIALALLWLTRADIDLGALHVPGWSGMFPHPEYITDGTVAIALSLLLFAIPAKSQDNDMVLGLTELRKLPFNILFLFGGGFALAKGFTASGLDLLMAGKLSALGTLAPLLLVLLTSLFVKVLTEVTSNTATAQLTIPILGTLALTTGVDPMLLLIPTTFAASFAFMLPVATPPNTIIFGTERVPIGQMVRLGVWMNLITLLVTTLAVFTWGRLVFG